ncbi:MAG TPA: 3-methyl-2-oxobutanoate hydroxymethyltransferase [Acidimicrobiales bacterium]|nr:3-methyl-2-oxobutanoate hydroxymethyltransferase [Acidimicrobiales bacterium]
MKLSAPAIQARKRRSGGDPIVMVTAYDEPGARLAAAGGVDVILVGDSLANVVLGQENTLDVSVEAMCHHVRAVANAHSGVHVVADMPWLSYHVSTADSVRNAAALVRAGADSVKLEGGRNRLAVVRALLDAEIPVMGHLGLTPQSVMSFGGFKVQAKTHEAAKMLTEDAVLLQEEGVYAIVIEAVPSIVGTRVTETLSIPTIGIGAGPDTDGQVLVFHDLLGMTGRTPAKFVRQYADLGAQITDAIGRYVQDVRNGSFPSESEAYANPEGLFD